MLQNLTTLTTFAAVVPKLVPVVVPVDQNTRSELHS